MNALQADEGGPGAPPEPEPEPELRALPALLLTDALGGGAVAYELGVLGTLLGAQRDGCHAGHLRLLVDRLGIQPDGPVPLDMGMELAARSVIVLAAVFKAINAQPAIRPPPPDPLFGVGAVLEAADGRAALVVGWERTPRTGDVRLSLMRDAGGRGGLLDVDMPATPLTALDGGGAAVAAWRSDAWRAARARAARMLRLGWWEEGFGADAARELPGVAAPHALAAGAATPGASASVLKLLRRPGVGKFFEALWAPDGGSSACFVPNAWRQRLFPHG